MALPDLLNALRDQAEARRAEELAAASALAERIRSESRTALERRRSEFVARACREEEDASHRALSRARAEAAAAVLSARDGLLTRVRRALDARIAAASADPAYLATLSSDVARGLARLPQGTVVVRARPELVASIAEALGDSGTASVEASNEVGIGFSATVPGEGVEVDGTLEARLEHAWPGLAVAALRAAAT